MKLLVRNASINSLRKLKQGVQRGKDAINIVKQYAEQFDMMVCSGGDGTVSEVMNGLLGVEKRPVFGYIPSGTFNGQAFSYIAH